jgi:hypothetical protein
MSFVFIITYNYNLSESDDRVQHRDFSGSFPRQFIRIILLSSLQCLFLAAQHGAFPLSTVRLSLYIIYFRGKRADCRETPVLFIRIDINWNYTIVPASSSSGAVHQMLKNLEIRLEHLLKKVGQGKITSSQ